MSSWQTLARVQYLMTSTPADDRTGRSTIGGPDFEMEPAEPAGRTVRRVPAPIVEPASAEPSSAPAVVAEPGHVGKVFVLAGRAIVTLVGRDSRYTFQINRKDPEPGSRFTEPAYFVALLTGPDNTDDYTYVGMLDAGTGKIRLTKKSRYTADSAPVRAFDWVMSRVWLGKAIAPAELLHAGRCGRCGRLLTVPSSIASGFGPECIGKVGL